LNPAETSIAEATAFGGAPSGYCNRGALGLSCSPYRPTHTESMSLAAACADTMTKGQNGLKTHKLLILVSEVGISAFPESPTLARSFNRLLTHDFPDYRQITRQYNWRSTEASSVFLHLGKK